MRQLRFFLHLLAENIQNLSKDVEQDALFRVAYSHRKYLKCGAHSSDKIQLHSFDNLVASSDRERSDQINFETRESDNDA